MPGYYDIDEILAQEELVSCQTLLDFSYLSHLNPDAALYRPTPLNDKNTTTTQRRTNKHVLPEEAILKVPIWIVEIWAKLRFVRVQSFPKHYGRRAREFLAADPTAVTLSPRFFQSGRALLHLVEESSRKQAEILKSHSLSLRTSQGTKDMEHLEKLLQEARQVRETLLQVRITNTALFGSQRRCCCCRIVIAHALFWLVFVLPWLCMQAYTGARLAQTMNWALSSFGDDVSAYVSKLTTMEKRLYRRAAFAAANHAAWKQQTSPVVVQQSAVAATGHSSAPERPLTTTRTAAAAVPNDGERSAKRPRQN